MKPKHPWKLVGPWYRWADPASAAAGRASAPVFQKFASPDFVNDFLEEPQRSLKFFDKDLLHEVVEGTVSRFRLSKKVRRKVEPECRKVFLDIHSRFYLVVCELHCDAPGFPSVSRDQVCEAGFVVRRRRAQVPAAVFEEVVGLLEQTQANRAQLRELKRVQPDPMVSELLRKTPSRQALDAALRRDCQTRLGRLVASHARDLERLETLTQAHGVGLVHEGWKPSEHQGIGAWVDVEETPQELEEEVYPLFPLIPDPAAARHSARGRSLYFGVLPTASSDVDETANPRFDDRRLYQVRCFVRRHRPACPKTSSPGDCSGELVWSRPTDKYRLAAATDLDGTSNRPVTIQLPDLRDLEAQASALPMGSGMGVRMVTPPGSSLPPAADGDDLPGSEGTPGGAQICSFSIPLITITANFVLRLFLPVVVFLFGLWFLLRLRFCIPPGLKFDADANLDLAVVGQLDAAVEADVDIDAGLTFRRGDGVPVSLVDLDVAIARTLRSALGNKMSHKLLTEFPLDIALPPATVTRHRNILVKLLLDLGQDFSGQAPDLSDQTGGSSGGGAGGGTFPPAPPEVAATLPSLTADLEHCPILEVPAA